MPEAREATGTDHAALRELFGVAGKDSPTESPWGHEESQAAVYPYLERGTVLVAVTGGTLVGYPAGGRPPGSRPPASCTTRDGRHTCTSTWRRRRGVPAPRTNW